jgi:phosphate transport system permease protein
MALPYHLYVISTVEPTLKNLVPLAYGHNGTLFLIILIIYLLANALRRYLA